MEWALLVYHEINLAIPFSISSGWRSALQNTQLFLTTGAGAMFSFVSYGVEKNAGPQQINISCRPATEVVDKATF